MLLLREEQKSEAQMYSAITKLSMDVVSLYDSYCIRYLAQREQLTQLLYQK